MDRLTLKRVRYIAEGILASDNEALALARQVIALREIAEEAVELVANPEPPGLSVVKVTDLRARLDAISND